METLPQEFGAASAVHRYFRFWCERGFFKTLWVAGLAAYDEAAGIQRDWLSADVCLVDEFSR
jgi:transposase